MEICISINGLGGLGLIKLTQSLCFLLSSQYNNVLSSEYRGIAQRRGSVSTNIRAGENIYTAQLYEKRADLIIGLESLETLRYPKLIKPGTLCLISDLRINNLGGNRSNMHYPETDEIVQSVSSLGGKAIVLPFLDLKERLNLLKIHTSTACLAATAYVLGYTFEALMEHLKIQLSDDKNLSTATEIYALFSASDKQTKLKRNVA